MKRITLEDIANAISEYNGVELESDGVWCYIHITGEGELVRAYWESDEDLSVHWLTDEDIESLTMEDIWDMQTLDNEKFRDVCEELLELVNEWFDENERLIAENPWLVED